MVTSSIILLISLRMNFQNTSDNNFTSYTFYAGLVQWDFIKVFYLIFHILLTFIGPILLYSIVWYERFSSDIRCRTLLNQLLAHICISSIIDCLINRTIYVSIIFIGPYSTSTCDCISFMGRFCFLIRIMELSIRQLIRYFYIFQWKYLVSLNNDFFAIYFTLCNVILSILLIFTSYQLGFHHADMDYHICTGKQPIDNIMNEFLKTKKYAKTDDLPPSFYIIIATDPLNILTQILFIMLVLIGIQTWAYSKKKFLKTIWKRIRRMGPVSPLQSSVNNNANNLEDTKNVILGASGTLAIIVLIILLNTPASRARYIAHIDPDAINHGTGRLWNYASRFSLPILNYCLLPIIILGSNSKMRKKLKREFKDFMEDL